MKHAVLNPDGAPSGVLYSSIKPEIVAHHAQYGQTLVPAAGLENTGTEEAPVWVLIPPSVEDGRAAMVCSRMQARIALHQAGLLAQIEAAVAAVDPVVQIAWAEASEFRRDSPTIAALAATLDPALTDEQLDTLFEAAMQITA